MKNISLKELIVTLEADNIVNGHSIGAIPLEVAENKSSLEIYKNFVTGKFTEDFFELSKLRIHQERNSQLERISKFYFTKNTYTDFHKNGLSPEEICGMVDKDKIRLKRLLMVFQPDYSQTITKKPNKDSYDMVKINWIDDDGDKVRFISKTYGRVGTQGLHFSVPKLIGEFFEKVEDIQADYKYLQENKKQTVADFMARIDGKTWIFEFKSTNKSDFIKSAVRLELWELYKKTYLV